MTAPEAVWREALGDGRLILQRSRASGDRFFPPRLAEPATGDEDWEWVDAIGLGTVYAVTVIHPKPPEPAYNVVLVDLDEGPRLMSRVEGIDPAAIRIGDRVRARIDGSGADALLLFEPA